MSNEKKSDVISAAINIAIKELENNKPNIMKFLMCFKGNQENIVEFLQLWLPDDENSIVNQINFVQKRAEIENDKDGLRQLETLKKTFVAISKNYSSGNRELLKILLESQMNTAGSTIKASKENAPKGRNKNERGFIIEELKQVLYSPDYDGCSYRGKFSRNKFITKYHPLLNDKYRKKASKITEKTIRKWINDYLEVHPQS